MRIRYVVSTMLFWGRENHLSFEQECQFLRSMGFGVELWPHMKGGSDCRYDRRNWPRLAAAAEGMLVSMRSRNDGPTLEKWQEQLECAKLLGASIVTDLRSLGIPNEPEPDSYNFAEEVVNLAELNKVKLCLETGRLSTLKQVGRKLESVWYCLDTGYANLDPEFDFKQYVDELGERVAYLHLSDNYGHADDHQPPGMRGGIGRKNWEHLLNVLGKYDNDIIASFEMCPSMPAVMLRQASEFLFDVLKWPDRPRKQPSYAGVAYNPT
ncbi:MAG: sugar phosphate isomerase/epimerase [Phycisphaerae bacterium]|nr:sugar phosphate isomerase/epimerase [Phycisphaerae bacterium]